MSGSAPDIIVVGAGLIGLSTADGLVRSGADVTVIDARDGPVRGASFANSGMIHPSQGRSWGPRGWRTDTERAAEGAVFDLARRSSALLRQRMETLGLSEALARPVGCYQLYASVDAARAAQSAFATAGVRANVVIDAGRTFSRPALYFPDDWSADANAYGCALEADLKHRGVTFIYEARDLRVRAEGDGVAAALGGHRFQAGQVVLCGGAQSAALLDTLGLRARIDPVRGWAVDFDLPREHALPPVPVMDAASRSALTVFPDRFRLSGTWGEDSARPLLERWADIIPKALAEAGKPDRVWSGLRPVSKAGRPYIGPTPVPGLWINAGHGHLGWTLSAGSGELMARMILDGWQDPRFAYAG